MLFLLAILFPMICGVCVSVFVNDDREKDPQVKQQRMRFRNKLYTAIMLAEDLLCLPLLFIGEQRFGFSISGTAGIWFCPDSFGRLCMCLILTLYTAVCFYSFVYMEHEERHEYFFAFFFLSLGALIAVCMSGSLVTMYAFFELAALCSMPLVLHELTKESVDAGKKYLFYSIGGALMGLCAIVTFYKEAGAEIFFTFGGSPALAGRTATGFFLLSVFLGILGFGTKAGLFPMHGWLPTAHPIAPAPASALMSGIIAKAGVIALIRLVFYSVGPERIAGTKVQTIWTCLCMLTVLLGSTRAFMTTEIKKRLAYSTISQISYILLALSLLTGEGLAGGLLQMLSHAMSKGCLFLCAGSIIHLTQLRQVKDLRGIGKKMPVTMWCFALASLSLVGIPPMGGFAAKWRIVSAALGANIGIFRFAAPVVLLISAMLTAGYLLPVVIAGFFPGKEENPKGKKEEYSRIKEPLLLVIPQIALVTGALIIGLFGEAILRLFQL